MTSEYEYATVADLENHTGDDYSDIASKYTDAVIEASISSAERKINGKLGRTFTGTIPDGIKDATLEIAAILMNNKLIGDEVITGKIETNYFNPSVLMSLNNVTDSNANDKSVFVGSSGGGGSYIGT